MSTQTQPTLEQLGVTVHKSVVGNPATGYVTWEDSKEYVLGQKLLPATAQQPAGGSGEQILRGEDAGPPPPQPDFEPAVLLSEPKSPGSEAGTPFKNHVVPARRQARRRVALTPTRTACTRPSAGVRASRARRTCSGSLTSRAGARSRPSSSEFLEPNRCQIGAPTVAAVRARACTARMLNGRSRVR